MFAFFTRSLLIVCVLTYAVPLCADQRGLSVRARTTVAEELKGDLWLLTIGIDSYLQWNRLKTAANDARAVKNALVQRYRLHPSRVLELYNEQATRKNIIASFRELARKVKADDSLIVFYAGHGHIDNITREGSWIPVESATDDPSAWISNHDIKNYLKVDAIRARHVLLISDSCFSGDFFRSSRGALPQLDDSALKKAYNRTSRQTITSGGLEPVSDSGFGDNSIFSHFLVSALNSNNKPYLIPAELFAEIRSGVGRNAEQLPQYGDLHGAGGQEGGELILFLNGEGKLQDIDAVSASRRKELEQMRRMEAEASQARLKEQQEIARKEAELAALDRQINEMKARPGRSVIGAGDNLDRILALAEQKESEAKKLDDLRRKRESEAFKRQEEIYKIRKESREKRDKQIEKDIEKYQKIASSRFAAEMGADAWKALLAGYPEAAHATQGDLEAFRLAVGPQRRNYRDQTTGMEFVYVEGGCYQMGDGAKDAEKHEVCVDDFMIGKNEVTQGEWKRVTRRNPSAFPKGDRYPVENVSWTDAMEFTGALNRLAGREYRLPTEAEWEYAARNGGRKERFGATDDDDKLFQYANYCDFSCTGNAKSEKQNDGHKNTAAAGSYKPNLLGIHDMTGNVAEWVGDWYDPSYFRQSPSLSPAGPASGRERVIRGGGWNTRLENIRIWNRAQLSPEKRSNAVGFRLVLPVR